MLIKKLLLITICLFGFLSTDHAELFTTEGSLSISDSGEANYIVPIDIIPGINNMQPDLSLAYSNMSGNGILGVGWQLKGLSSITRCAQTKRIDGVTKTITYTNEDRLCLDGQRLLVTEGNYWDEGKRYQTEVASFSKITSIGLSSTGEPKEFKVWTKSGNIMYFGSDDHSRIGVNNHQTIHN